MNLLLALAGVSLSARAGQEVPTTPAPAPTTPAPETPAPQTPKASKPVEQQLNGRVVAVDKVLKTITLQVNYQTYVLKTIPDTRFTKAGKSKSFEDLIVGEEITVTVALQETSSGRVEIAVVSVDLPTTTEAQGGRSSGGGGGYGGIPPFITLPNPANVGGPIRSPSR